MQMLGGLALQTCPDAEQQQEGRSLLCPCHIKDGSFEVEQQEKARGHRGHSYHSPPQSFIWQNAHKGDGNENAERIASMQQADHQMHCPAL